MKLEFDGFLWYAYYRGYAALSRDVRVAIARAYGREQGTYFSVKHANA